LKNERGHKPHDDQMAGVNIIKVKVKEKWNKRFKKVGNEWDIYEIK
jgi:hypothetical protein